MHTNHINGSKVTHTGQNAQIAIIMTTQTDQNFTNHVNRSMVTQTGQNAQIANPLW